MVREITSLDLSFRRRSIIGFTLGMAAYTLVVVALYPAFRDASNLDELATSSPGVAALFGISGNLTSPTGWLDANIYANFLPLVALLVTVGYGAAALAGQEHDGHLELVLALPTPRHRIVADKITALAIQAAILVAAVLACVLAGRAFQLSVASQPLVTTTLGVFLLAVDFGLVALAVGAATGSRGTAIGVAATIAAASYLLSSLAPVVGWLKPARVLSLFYWAVGDSQLDTGVTPAGFAVLLGVAIVATIATVTLFNRHDVS